MKEIHKQSKIVLATIDQKATIELKLLKNIKDKLKAFTNELHILVKKLQVLICQKKVMTPF